MAPETPKGVSSRLLSMKFMQRAAASAASTPGSDSDAHSAKKRKLGHDSAQDRFEAEIDQASIQAAIDEREAKRQAALEKHSGSETHWVLDSNWDKKASKSRTKPMNIVYVGYGDFDPSDDDEDSRARPGRTSTKNYKSNNTQDLNKPNQPNSEEDDSEQDSDDQESDAQDPRGSTGSSPSSREPRSRSHSLASKQRHESLRAKELRDKRKKKEVKLNKLTSISSAGDNKASGSPSGMTCFTCHQPGHKASDCPQKSVKGHSRRG